MADQRAVFDNKLLPYLLVLPQMVIVGLFFLWPGFQALVLSLFREDAFGTRREFVGLENFACLFASDAYLNSMQVTFLFSFWVMVIAISVALYPAILADRAVKGSKAYTNLLIWPYALAYRVGGNRRGQAAVAVLEDRLSALESDDVLPDHHEHHVFVLPHLRDHSVSLIRAERALLRCDP